MSALRIKWRLVLAIAWLSIAAAVGSTSAQTAAARIEAALQNVTALMRPDRVGYANLWDGNRYVQCRRLADRTWRCEAGGPSLQPSLRLVLSPERLRRLATFGWVVDPAFGNFVRHFPADIATSRMAELIAQTLAEGYGADPSMIEVATAWVVDMPCPPRNGPSQNLAGLVSDEESMRASALRSCSYTPASQGAVETAASADELVAIYGATVSAEIQRLRINAGKRVFAVFSAGIGYIQCQPDASPPILYCEAQSAESWPALSAILTPARLARLRQAGYAEPGRAPNHWKIYSLAGTTDAAIAAEILALLYEVYGYRGATKLSVETR